MWYDINMQKGVNVKLSIGDISSTGKKVLSWNYNQPRHKKYTMQCTLCGYVCETSIKSFYNTCKSCSTVRVNSTTKEKQLWNRYKNRAKRDGIVFTLTENDLVEIIYNDCFYCGEPPSQKIILARREDNELIYNGIDRKYDSDGYTKINCVACCWVCNQAKKNYGLQVFKDMVVRWSERVDQW